MAVRFRRHLQRLDQICQSRPLVFVWNFQEVPHQVDGDSVAPAMRQVLGQDAGFETFEEIPISTPSRSAISNNRPALTRLAPVSYF